MKRRLLLLLAVTLMGSSLQGFPVYYDIADHDAAQAEARQRNLPLAWLGGFPNADPSKIRSGSAEDLQQKALDALQDRAVVIFFDGMNMAPVPAIVHAQFHIQDDGELPNGASWKTPKVVFTNPEVTQILGRVSETEMHADGDVPLNSALQVIRNNPDALAPPDSSPPSSAPAIASTPETDKESPGLDGLSMGWAVMDFCIQNSFYLTLGVVFVAVALGWFVWSRRPQ